jgi:hypothetical protein
MKTLFITLLLFMVAGVKAQPPRITAREVYSGQVNGQNIRVYLETIETFEKEFNSYITTAHKGWYQLAAGKKIRITDNWEGNGPMELEKIKNGRPVKVFTLDDYTGPDGSKTLKGIYYSLNREYTILLTLIRKLK